jgi:hypothetical protein
MANTTLAGEKSNVKINHASIASGNLSLMVEIKKKKSLGKKTSRKPEEKENASLVEKKPILNQENSIKPEKSNFYNLFK